MSDGAKGNRRPQYGRILLKLSGEALLGNEQYGVDGKPLPHAFTFLPAGLDNDALKAVFLYLDHRLSR